MKWRSGSACIAPVACARLLEAVLMHERQSIISSFASVGSTVVAWGVTVHSDVVWFEH